MRTGKIMATVLAPDCRSGTDNDITGSIVDIGWYLDTDLVAHWECNVLCRGYEGSTTRFSAEAKGVAFESLGAAPIWRRIWIKTETRGAKWNRKR